MIQWKVEHYQRNASFLISTSYYTIICIIKETEMTSESPFQLFIITQEWTDIHMKGKMF